ncbi:carbohydrate sulfotransferase 1-like [Mercenaria mercenaria]|uniref:carbohydrate sulfotransferase 1-like n=1 Tax=Mercenaria mercenaria TaxID=6596 RepID=UPI00234E4975|nr:carbohydrate sulfotransferase 1-like [Mercenaria mercenaria]
MAREVFTHSQDLCSRMYEDVIQHMKLQKLYHKRLKLVIYEALTERPINGARDIYKFLNMTMTKQVVQWIYQTTHANKTADSEYFGTSRNNAIELMTSWRMKMDLLKVQVIDYFCKDLYTLVGFIPMNSTEQLSSLSVPSRRKSSIDGFV